MNEQPMSRQIAWRRQYDKQRYARHLTHKELIQRIGDVLWNLFALTPEGKLAVGAFTEFGEFTDESALWCEKFMHVMEEMQLRCGPFPAGLTRDIFHSAPVAKFASEFAKKAAKRLSPIRVESGNVLIKFGERQYMERLYESGSMRIQPASYFGQVNHNTAVRDDELRLSISLALTREDVLAIVQNPQDVPPDAPEQRANVQFESPTDYWIYCLTTSVGPRLFVDFDADSCVIIRDRERFRDMLHEATREHLGDTAMRDGSAIYIDPLFPPKGNIFLPFVKHFRYTYQEEYRFCWLPAAPASRVAHVDLEVGSLKDFSDLIIL